MPNLRFLINLENALILKNKAYKSLKMRLMTLVSTHTISLIRPTYFIKFRDKKDKKISNKNCRKKVSEGK